MRREEEVKGDVLKGYFDESGIEKAPEGFTSKVMSHIYMQAKPVKHEKKLIIAYAYAGITAMLVIMAFIIPSGSLKFPEIVIPEKLHINFPQFGESIRVSPTALYVLAAIILLAVFDFGLKSFFHREKNGG